MPPLEETGPDQAGLFGLEAVPGRATPDWTDASQPYLGNDEEVLEEVFNNLRAAVFGILPNGGIATALTQAAWFVDSVNGNNANDGKTPATAVQTYQEIVRRWGPVPVLKQATLITILSGALLAGDAITLRSVDSDEIDHILNIRGTATASTVQLGNAGVITAVTAINHAVADGALKVTVAAQDWTAFVGKPCRITGGPRNGAIGYVAKANIAAGQARFTPFTLIPLGQQGPMGGSQIVTPQVNDVLTVLDFTKTGNPLIVEDGGVPYVFELIDFQDDAAFSGQRIYSNDANAPTFNYCILEDFLTASGTPGPIAFNGCHTTAIIATGPNIKVLGCLATGNTNGTISAGLDTIYQGARLLAGSLGMSGIGDAAFYDTIGANGAAISVLLGGRLTVAPVGFGESANGTVYGIGNAGFVFIVGNMGMVQYKSAATLIATATIAFLKLSGVNHPIGDLPLVLDANLNAMVNSAA
jgi:hypothetical protein